ncbi:MAG: hypothetical protein AAF558_06015, partial [Verrucomicrobiota bacterium]
QPKPLELPDSFSVDPPFYGVDETAEITEEQRWRFDQQVSAKEVLPYLDGWAENDPNAAEMWSRERLNGPLSRQDILMIFMLWSRQGLSSASHYLSQVPEHWNRREFVRTVAESAFINGPSSALEWAETLEDQEIREIAIDTLVYRLSSNDSVDIGKWMSELVQNGYTGDGISTTAKMLTLSDPKQAGVWVLELPNLQSQKKALGNVIEIWAGQDLQSAGDFLNRFPPEGRTDEAVQKYALAASFSEPQTAMTWAESITDIQIRQRTMLEVARSWKNMDRTEYQKWLSVYVMSSTDKRTFSGILHEP